MEIKFEDLPMAVSQLIAKLDRIENLLLNKNAETPYEPDALITILEAADFLRLKVPTIYGLVHEGKIPVSKPGKRLYFSKQELVAWVKSRRIKTNIETAIEAANYLNRNKT